MNCTKTYRIKNKVITVAWCKIGFLVAATIIFIVCERLWGPF